MSEIKLLPCPCCGGEALLCDPLKEEVFIYIPQVVCSNCGLEVTSHTVERVVEKWNTRKPMQEIVERLEEYGSIWVQYQEIMTKDKIVESVLKQAKEQCIRIVKEVGEMNAS